MTTPEIPPQEFLEYYGTCVSDLPATAELPRCRCLKTGWLGRACPYWRPVGFTNWPDMVEHAKKTYLAKE